MTGSGISIYGGVKVSTAGTTGSGLDQIVDIIVHDPGILASGSTASVNGGAQAANALDQLILEGAAASNALADGIFTADEVRAINAWIRADAARYAHFIELHGDDEGNVETGYHLIQNDGGAFQFNGQNFANTIVDGIFHIGFEINANNQFLNEDGNANASVNSVTRWLNQLYVDVIKHDETPLSRIAWGILGDSRLYNKFGIAAQREATASADGMNAILAQGIAETGIASDGQITAADVVALNGWLRADAARLSTFLGYYGTADKGFYRAVDDTSGTMFGQRMVDTVANGIYSLGFALSGDNVGSLAGSPGQSVANVAAWLDYFLGNQPSLHGGTGLDRIVDVIFDDPGLAQATPLADIRGGAEAAAGLNALLIEAMDATGARTDGWITPEELRAINAWVRADQARYTRFVELHGDDENGTETGYHLVQNDGSAMTLENRNFINTVADGIYHFGFDIKNGVFLNEDGDANQSLSDVSIWLNEIMQGVVTIRAHGGSDPVVWTESAVQVIDSGGSRTITTGDFNDYVSTTWSSDSIFTGGGDDVIRSGPGDDKVDGGNGSDTYLYANSAGDNFHGYDQIKDSGTTGTDRIIASGTNSTIGVKGFTGHGIEAIDVTGVTGKAVLLDNGSTNTIDLRGVTVTGALIIDSSWGNDTVYGSDAAETILGGWGDDTLNGGGGGDTYLYADSVEGKFQGYDKFADTGASGVDRIVATGANSTIGVIGFGPASGIEAIDVSGVTGKAVLLDNGSTNTIDLRGVTVTGKLIIDSSWGNDTVYGSDAAETILGGWGDDMLNGGGGGDTYLYADSVEGKFQGYDKFADTGASGTDKIVATGVNSTIGVIGFGPASGIEAIDVSGVTGKAVLLDNGSTNTIDLRGVAVTGNLIVDASWGDDVIYGSASADRLLGSGGNDTIDGGAGNDVLSGGSGSDKFHVSSGWGKDTITDFEVGKDKIDLHDALVGSFAALAVTQSGADTLVTSANGSFLLLGISATTINASSFIF